MKGNACILWSCFFAYRHPLLLSTTENIHPVLNSIPGAFSLENVPQLHIVQVFFQHLLQTEIILVIQSNTIYCFD